jgi:putative endonuclease
VYIPTNPTNTVYYTGVTNDLARRLTEHRERKNKRAFTARYGVSKLVYFEEFDDPTDAITREKQIKAGSRAKKKALIKSINPEWKDLAGEIFERYYDEDFNLDEPPRISQ